MSNVRDALQEQFNTIKAAHATTPAYAAEFYELHGQDYQDMLEWCTEQSARMSAQGMIPVEALAAQLFFTLLLGAKLHQKGIVP